MPGAANLPTRYELLGAFPNPFNPSTEIRFLLPRETHVALRIYDASGRLLRVLANGRFPAGQHGVSWNGRDHRGQVLGSGVYFYAIRAGTIDAVEKMLLIK